MKKKLLVGIVAVLAFVDAWSQGFIHEFIDAEDSVQVKGVKISLKMDSVYFINDSSAIKFTLKIFNGGKKTIDITNPIYDTDRRVNFSLYKLPENEKVQLNEFLRWPIPELAKNFKAYKIESIAVNESLINSDEYGDYWEREFLTLEPDESIAYNLNLFQRIEFDSEDNRIYKSLRKSEYYLFLNILLEIEGQVLPSYPFRGKIVLK